MALVVVVQCDQCGICTPNWGFKTKRDAMDHAREELAWEITQRKQFCPDCILYNREAKNNNGTEC